MSRDAPLESDARTIVKRLSSREHAEPEAILRRRSEATLLAKLSSSGVAPRLVARGEDDRGPWHAMERVAIPTLAERLRRASESGAPASPAGWPIGPDWIERAARVAYEALAIVHEARDEDGPLAIVHADLSPANLAIDDAAEVAILLDFDLALWRDAPREARADGAFRGTIGYTAPEVARGEAPTPASDLFSLAASLLHAATGRAPRTGAGTLPFAALLAMAAEEPITGPAPALERGLPALAGRGPGHAAIVRCLAHDPGQRPPSARAAAALAAVW